MAEFSRLIITEKGQQLISKIFSGATGVKFTKISTSSKFYEEDELSTLEALAEIRQTNPVAGVERTESAAVKVVTAFTNSELTEGYYLRSMGLFAEDPDEGEILYGVTAELSGNCYMPPCNGVTLSALDVEMVTAVGNAENISLEVDPAAAVTVEQLNAHIADGEKHLSTDDRTKLIALSNPNLLDNPDFKINQRGKNEYIGVGYSLDRWASVRDATKVQIENDTVTITSMIVQQLNPEFSDVIFGKKLTFSCKIAGKIISYTFIPKEVMNNWANQAHFTDSETNVTLIFGGKVTLNYWVGIIAESPQVVEWAKLELGSVATPFIPPDPATELLKCQRYYVRATGAGVVNSVSTMSDTQGVDLIFPTRMRITPTASLKGVAFTGMSNIDLTNSVYDANWQPKVYGCSIVFRNDKLVQYVGMSGLFTYEATADL